MTNQIIDTEKSYSLDYDFTICRDLGKNTSDKNFTKSCEYWNDRIFIEKSGEGFYMFKKIERNGKPPMTRLVYKEEKDLAKLKHGFNSKLKAAIADNCLAYDVVLENADWIVDKEKKLINVMSVVYASTLKNIKVGEEGKKYRSLRR